MKTGKAYWIGGTRPDAAHGQEMSIVAALRMDDRVWLDEFAPALFDRREDAERVLAELQKRFPEMRDCIVR